MTKIRRVFLFVGVKSRKWEKNRVLLKILVSANTNMSVCYRCISLHWSTADVFHCVRHVSQRNLIIHVDRILAFFVYIFVFFSIH